MDLDKPAEILDLRGIKCPLNWARAKARLETMAREERLELWVDDPRAVEDIPAAAEIEGWAVIGISDRGTYKQIDIER